MANAKFRAALRKYNARVRDYNRKVRQLNAHLRNNQFVLTCLACGHVSSSAHRRSHCPHCGTRAL